MSQATNKAGGEAMKKAILEHARKIDDYIQFARRELKDRDYGHAEQLLGMASETYLELNEAGSNLADNKAGKNVEDDDRQANLEGLAFDAGITVPRAWSLLDMAHEHLKAGKTRDAITLVLSARETIGSLYAWLNPLKGGEA